MNKIRITVMAKACHPELSRLYENPIEHACDLNISDVFVSEDGKCPDGLCSSAWDSMASFVFALSYGASDFYQGWMKKPRSAMISCNDGFRPVSFYLEVIDD